ncbi:OmpA family protein [Sphingobacterium sp. SGR-19]|uniref:OmpA family protein n=1 Tax=Sphingobacterium sp. SGR-19 TaxID=2710886 RepID=UPI0013EB70D3|nr:OmpA family protein [Sphingobacterium sp. SGR-19]NGM64075.1 OmpA family protein [Sphingobacterium sp. SGR-19]
MKNFIILSLFALGGASAGNAQSLPVTRDTTVTVSTDRYKVVTNRFGDNVFFGIGAGAQIFFGDHDKQMKFGERLTPTFNGYLGKWFSPGFGARVGGSFGKITGVTQSGLYSTGEPYEGKSGYGYWLSHEEFKSFHVYGDALFNLTNLFSGYKERFYNISPYAGLGYMVVTDEPRQHEVSMNIGLYNTFRLAKPLHLTLDVRGAMVHDRFDGDPGRRRQDGSLTASLGLAYRFNKRDWDKPETTIIEASYDESLLNELRDRVRKLADDNDALRRQLADAKGEVITDIQFKDRILAAPILVTFKIDTWEVRNEARVNLGFFAETIKRGSPDVVYTITGYADKGTGSAARNELLSRNRAAAIKKVLVEEFGVDPSRLRTEHKGGVENMYYNDPRVSRAVIVIGE